VVIQGLSLPRMVIVAPLLVVVLLVGCSDSSRYPADLPYPLRKDLLITSMPPDKTNHLPGPGQLEESIKTAATEVLNAKSLDPNKLNGEERKELDKALKAVFGSPRSPKVEIDNALDLDPRTLSRGSQHYRRHCLHCHGLSGDGRGPTASWVNPHPRDYRSGWFKFLSTDPNLGGAKPRRADLLRTLRVGIDGTSMPSFALLADQELEELISYVIHLSIRGETEFKTMTAIIEAINNAERANKDRKDALAGLEGGGIAGQVKENAANIIGFWQDAQKSVNAPPRYSEKLTEKAERDKSVVRGYRLFIGKAGCISCHTDFGRQPLYQRDIWGTLVRPNNLTAGVYRGGRRPLDIFYRATRGIPPSQMPGVGSPVVESEKAAATRQALAQKISVDFKNVPLNEALQQIENKLNKGVHFVKPDRDEPVTWKGTNLPASEILAALGARFTPRDATVPLAYSIISKTGDKNDGLVKIPTVPSLTGDEVWDVVNFVQSLPYPAMLPDEVRQKIYPPQVAASR
jgi:mono/diheme cytochrome c family protein